MCFNSSCLLHLLMFKMSHLRSVETRLVCLGLLDNTKEVFDSFLDFLPDKVARLI